MRLTSTNATGEASTFGMHMSSVPVIAPYVSHTVGGANDTGIPRDTKAHCDNKSTILADTHDHTSNGKSSGNTWPVDNDATAAGLHDRTADAMGKAKCFTHHETCKDELSGISPKHVGGPMGDVHINIACAACKLGVVHLARNAIEPDTNDPHPVDEDLTSADLATLRHENTAESCGVVSRLGTH